MVATSHKWLLSPQKLTSATKQLYFKSKSNQISTDLNLLSPRAKPVATIPGNCLEMQGLGPSLPQTYGIRISGSGEGACWQSVEAEKALQVIFMHSEVGEALT